MPYILLNFALCTYYHNHIYLESRTLGHQFRTRGTMATITLINSIILPIMHNKIRINKDLSCTYFVARDMHLKIVG